MKHNPFAQPEPRVLVPRQIQAGRALGRVHAFSGHCMGTSWQVRLVGEHLPIELPEQIADLLERLEAQMSHFRPQSELCRLAALPAGVWQTLSPELARVLRAALEVARASGGAFDPTVARVVDAWGFGAGPRFTEAGFTPPRTAPAQAAPGWQQLQVDALDRVHQEGGVALNLAAIAKGFAVDAVSEFLQQAGWTNHLVEVGGELRGTGIKPDGQPWWVALELPAADCGLPMTRIALHGWAVATSGAYRRQYRVGAQRIQHTMDPRTGWPVTHGLASVSVLHRECMLADAWATALMVLGPAEGLALAEKMQLCALLQGQDESGRWTEVMTTAWRDLL